MKHHLDKFEKLIEAFESLPTIGKKSATKLAYFIAIEEPFVGMQLANAMEEAISSLKRCHQCGFITQDEICHICSDEDRLNTLCVVESAKDVSIIESLKEYKGRYFILEELNEEALYQLKSTAEGVEEIIFALTPSIHSDATILYLEEQLKHQNLRFSKIAQGVPTGVNLENVDFLSLSKALNDRREI